MSQTVGYLAYIVTSPGRPSGGSIPGLVFAFAGTALIVFAGLLSWRKKYPASPMGRVSTWLRAHIWLELLSFLLILFHAHFSWGEGLASFLMWIFLIITGSGVFGLLLQNYLPRRMTELVPRETVYEEIPALIQTMRLEADERVEFITADLGLDEEEPAEEVVMAGGKKYYFDQIQRKSAAAKVEAVQQQRKARPQIHIDDAARDSLRNHYLQEVRPFLYPESSVLSRDLFDTADAVSAYFRYLKTIMPVAAHDVLEDLQVICDERRQLEVQRRLHHWLHGWLYLHIPLSFLFLVLTGVHAFMSLRYYMSEKGQPVQYHRRVRDTKKLAQRINLLYYLRPNAFRDWRRRLTFWLPLLAVAGILPFVLNIGGGGAAIPQRGRARAGK